LIEVNESRCDRAYRYKAREWPQRASGLHRIQGVAAMSQRVSQADLGAAEPSLQEAAVVSWGTFLSTPRPE